LGKGKRQDLTPQPCADNRSKERTESNLFDLPVIFLISSTILLLITIGSNLFIGVDENSSTFLLLLGLVCIAIAVISAHLKFKNTTVTIILTIFLLATLSIGFKIYTSKEIADKASSYFTSEKEDKSKATSK